LPLDLIEALTYGREWQLGYDKLPPLPWWLVEVTRVLFGPDLFYYALAQAAVVAAFIAVWALARPLVGAAGALAALLILDGLHYLHYTAAKFNHDVIQLPFWALAGLCYWAAVRRGRMIHWIVLGLALGLALWAKYFVIVLAVPLALFLLIDHDARRVLATPGPYVAAAVALVVAAPHLLWLLHNDFLPFRYAEARAVPSRGLFDHLWHPVQFAVGQIAFMLPALLIAAPLIRPRAGSAAPAADAFDRRIVTLLAFGPAATVIALSFITGRGTVAMWGYPLWLFLGLWIVLQAGGKAPDHSQMARLVVLWAVVFWGFALAFVTAYGVMPAYDGRYRAVFFPGERLATDIAARFRVLTGRPLAYVIASMWTGGNIAHYAMERPRVLIDGSPRRAPWIDLGDLRAKGAVVVWVDGDPRALPIAYRSIAEDAELQQPFTLPYRRGPGSITVGWAVLRPRPAIAIRPAP
jgi:4-amino-4-deoxy-L-arabinose transferase-like glycosyltransferase